MEYIYIFTFYIATYIFYNTHRIHVYVIIHIVNCGPDGDLFLWTPKIVHLHVILQSEVLKYIDPDTYLLGGLRQVIFILMSWFSHL